MEKTIGIISEGVTDQIVLENILFGWTGDNNLSITRLQPKTDETGNWDKVFKYCQSDDFKGALAFCDVLIVQLDTDFMLRGDVSDAYRIPINNLSIEETVQAFKTKLIELIGDDFYKIYQEQIIFAISVHEIECWFLPIYFENQRAKAAKTENCIETLNTVLYQIEGFYIHEKRITYYEKIAKNFRKKKNLERFSPKNKSFDMFIQELKNRLD